MINLELGRAIVADRERELEGAMRRRRLLELLAIGSAGPRARTTHGQRLTETECDERTGPSGSPALGSAR